MSSEALSREAERDRKYMVDEINQMLEEVRNDALPTPALRYRGLGRLVVDQWSPHDQLASEVIDLEDLYMKL